MEIKRWGELAKRASCWARSAGFRGDYKESRNRCKGLIRSAVYLDIKKKVKPKFEDEAVDRRNGRCLFVL
jgi:hypothetical protein